MPSDLARARAGRGALEGTRTEVHTGERRRAEDRAGTQGRRPGGRGNGGLLQREQDPEEQPAAGCPGKCKASDFRRLWEKEPFYLLIFGPGN